MTDLTAAIDAAAEALRVAAEPTNWTPEQDPECGPDEEECFRLHPVHFVWYQLGETGVMGETKAIANAAIEAALPHLRRAFAEEAAKAIEDAVPCEDACHPGQGCCGGAYRPWADAYARLVREMGAE